MEVIEIFPQLVAQVVYLHWERSSDAGGGTGQPVGGQRVPGFPFPNPDLGGGLI